jgi:predicted nucleic acid-binding protein
VTPRPLVRGLLDTPLLLGIRAGDPDPLVFAADMLAAHLPFELSRQSALVIAAWCPTPWDRSQFRSFLRSATVYSLTARIADRAFHLLDRLPPPAPLSADDAIVAPTALIHKLPLYTLDPARFAAVPGLTAVRPY